jgi:hypothetical protein
LASRFVRCSTCSGAPSHRLPQGSGQGIVAGRVRALKVAGERFPNIRFVPKADIGVATRSPRRHAAAAMFGQKRK